METLKYVWQNRKYLHWFDRASLVYLPVLIVVNLVFGVMGSVSNLGAAVFTAVVFAVIIRIQKSTIGYKKGTRYA